MMSASGRNDQASTLGTNLDLLVATYRREYNYPSWFNNTLGYAEKGQISVQALQNAANNLLNNGTMTRKPMYQTKMDSKRVREIIEDYHGDDIEMLHGHASDLGTRMDINWDEGQKQRDRIDAEIIKGANERQLFHDMHLDQETRISGKAGIGHTHAGGGGVKECEWWNIFCKMQTQIDEGFQGLGKLALIGGAAIIGIWLLKMRLGK